MFNLGFSELIVIGIIALIFIGPKQLPEVAQTIGRLLNEFKRATGDITGSFVRVRDEADQVLRKAKDQVSQEIDSTINKIGTEKITPDREKVDTALTNNDGDKKDNG